MSNRFVQTHLRRIPQFEHLNAGQMAWLASIVQPLEFTPGQDVVRQGQPMQGAFVFVDGGAIVLRRDATGVERQIGTLVDGGLLDVDALQSSDTEAVTVRVTVSSVVLFLPSQRFQALLAAQPDLRTALQGPPRPETLPQMPSRPAPGGASTGAMPIPMPTRPVNLPQEPPQPDYLPTRPGSIPEPPPGNIQASRPVTMPTQPVTKPQPTQPAPALQGFQRPAEVPHSPGGLTTQPTPAPPPHPGQFLNAPRQTQGMLPATMTLPSASRRSQFPGQRNNETVLLLSRRHWWAFMRHLWLPLVASVVLLLVSTFFLTSTPPLALGLSGLAVVIPGLLGLYLYFEWLNDSIVVTDDRVVRIERVLLRFSTNISEVPLASIHEVSSDLPSGDPFARLFHYGTISIRTAGDAGNILLHMIPEPEQMQQVIFNNRNRKTQVIEAEQMAEIQGDIGKVLRGEQIATGEHPALQASGAQGYNPNHVFSLHMKFTYSTGETVYRKHVMVLLSRLLVPLFFFLAALTTVGLALFYPPVSAFGLPAISASGLLVVVGGLWMYWVDWDWRNDIYVVGDDRITLIRKRPLWLQNQNEQFLLSQVDNVISDTQGLLNSLLDYGDVKVSLVGSDINQAKILESVHQPQEVQAEISRRQAHAKIRVQYGDNDRQRKVIADYIAAYHEIVAKSGKP